MRFRVPVCVLIALFCLADRGLLRAQFQEPTKEELQMTDDPKAPGAAAVYFYREETVDDQKHFHTFYVRLKVLTEKGKDLATVHVPYEHGDFKVSDIHGRTIHPDGTIVALTAKPEDLVDVKTKSFQRNTMVFTLLDVEVGSILEYRLSLRYDDNIVSSPDWDVQQPYYVHKAHYSFWPSSSGYITNSRGDVLNRIMFSGIGIPTSKVVKEASGRFALDLTDIPAIPDEDWMPPLNSLTWRMKFYYTQYSSGGDFWQSEGKRWSKEADKFANPTSALRGAVAQIVAPADSDEQKAHKIYAAVMKLENTDFTREKSEAEKKKEKIKNIKDAEAVWNEKAGSSDQLALLYVALARAAGLQAYPMQVVDRNKAIFDPDYLSVYQLDDYIAIVKIGDKEVYLDPGEKLCPFGLLHWKHTFAGGLRDSTSGPQYAVVPALTYTQTTVQRLADLTVSADGSLSGMIRIVMTGEEALHWRQLNLENDETEVKKRFNEWVRGTVPDGVQADFDHFLALDDYESNLMAIVKLSGTLGTATGKRVFLPGQFFESRGTHPFVAEEKRTIPVDVKYPKLYKDDVNYRLPEGMSVESKPETADISWPQTAVMKVQAGQTKDGVEVARTLAYNFTLVDPKLYGDLHSFYQKVAAADQQQVVLTRAAVATK